MVQTHTQRHGLTNKLPKEPGRDGMTPHGSKAGMLVYVSKRCKALLGGCRHEEGQMSSISTRAWKREQSHGEYKYTLPNADHKK